MADRKMEVRQGRVCRVKSEVRHWLDKVVQSAIVVATRDHSKLNLSRDMIVSLRKRIAGSISDGLEKKLQRGEVFEMLEDE